MISPKVKICILVAAHVAGGLILAWTAQPYPANASYVGLLALMFADAGLLSMWGGLSATGLARRFVAVIAAIIYPLTVVFAFLGVGGIVDLFVGIVLPLATLIDLVVLSSLRYGQRRLRLAHLSKELPASRGFQFSIRHLMLATAVVAILLAIMRADILLPDTLVLFVVSPVCLIVLELATLLAALGVGHPARRLAIVVPPAFVIGTIHPIIWGLNTDHYLSTFVFVVCSAIVGLQVIIMAASLLVVRSCGWRLVWGSGGMADQQVLLEDQGAVVAGASR